MPWLVFIRVPYPGEEGKQKNPQKNASRNPTAISTAQPSHGPG